VLSREIYIQRVVILSRHPEKNGLLAHVSPLLLLQQQPRKIQTLARSLARWSVRHKIGARPDSEKAV